MEWQKKHKSILSEAIGKLILTEIKTIRSEIKKEFSKLELKIDSLSMCRSTLPPLKEQNFVKDRSFDKTTPKRRNKLMENSDTYSVSSEEVLETNEVIDITDYFDDIPLGKESSTTQPSSSNSSTSRSFLTQKNSYHDQYSTDEDFISDDQDICETQHSACFGEQSTSIKKSSNKNTEDSDFSSSDEMELDDNRTEVQNNMVRSSTNLSANEHVEKPKTPPLVTVTPSCSFVKQMIRCPRCDHLGHCSKAMLCHVQTHYIKHPSRCFLCKKQCSRISSLQHHMESHARRLVHQCKFCLEIFQKIQNLKDHVAQIHTPDDAAPVTPPPKPKTHNHRYKVYRCDVCDKSFTQQAPALVHMRSHTGERPYECIFCSKTYIRRDHLRRHHRTHTGEKPYQCKVCSKTFADFSALSRHKKQIHSNL